MIKSNMHIFLYVLILPVGVLFGAASSSSSLAHRSVYVPYIDVLLYPEIVLREHFVDDYERDDLIAFAQKESKKTIRSNIERILHLLSIITDDTSTIDLLKLIDNEYFSSLHDINLITELLRKSLKNPTINDALRQLTADALRDRLKGEGPVISRAFFSPLYEKIDDTKIEETILWLIRTEQKFIKIATYFLTNKRIVIELCNAAARGVDVDIIIDKTSFPQELLDALHIPYKIWQNNRDLNALMHHKFMLFGSNLDGHAILVNGSFNITEQANRNHENIIVLNNPLLFNQFLKRFIFVDKFAIPVSVSTSDDDELRCSQVENGDKDTSWQAPARKLLTAFEALKNIREVHQLSDVSLWEGDAPETGSAKRVRG